MVEGFGPLGRSFQLILESFAVLATWAVICAAGTSAAEPTDQKTPLWSFAWVTDMHLDDSLLDYTAGAFRHIDEQLKPHFVVITGDNNAIAPPPTDPKHPEPQATRRQLFLKDYLGKNLKTPYAIIPGDNWPEDFDRVFGPRQYSFDCGGLAEGFLPPAGRESCPGEEVLPRFFEGCSQQGG